MAKCVIKLIVCLGNPGSNYVSTRHNIGFWFLNKLISQYGTPVAKEKIAKVATTTICYGGVTTRVLQPNVFMNCCGHEIGAYTRYFDISPHEVLVVHDELDFEAGMVRFKQGGGCAGHNGLKSIKVSLQSSDFLRLRFGIGHPGHSRDIANYVLSKPSQGDIAAIDQAIETAISYLEPMLFGNFQELMRKLHV